MTRKTQSQTAVQAWCKACEKPVEVKHECPEKVVEFVRINPSLFGGF